MEEPYIIKIPADNKWDVTAGLLKYEQYFRKQGYDSEATDLILLCDDIEHQIQEQVENRKGDSSSP